MKERPILMSAPMVKALRAGTKTQTRRVINPQPTHFNPHGVPRRARPDGGSSDVIRCPYGQPGDRLWVREKCAAVELPEGLDGVRYAADGSFRPINDTDEAADQWLAMNHYGGRRSAWVPSIHMPRWASRIMLQITHVRVQRLHQISASDAIAEGIELCHTDMLGRHQWRMTPHKDGTPGPDGEVVDYVGKAYTSRAVDAYRALWLSINGPGTWDMNPLVWAIHFQVVNG